MKNNNWISIDKLPTEDYYYLVWNQEDCLISKALFKFGQFHLIEDSFDGKITHWMHLPDPPIEKSDNNKEYYGTELTLSELKKHYIKHYLSADSFIELVELWHKGKL